MIDKSLIQRTLNVWLRYLAFGAIVYVCSCTEEHANPAFNQDGNIDILGEFRLQPLRIFKSCFNYLDSFGRYEIITK